VTDQNGHPVAGVTVTFSVTAGRGTVTGATQVTDANGIATVGSWTLGTAGVNELQAAFNTGVSRGYTIFVATAFLPSWTQTLSGTGDVCSIATGAGGVVFAAAYSGVYRSTDNGATWTLVGLSSVYASGPSAVAINPTNNHVFAGLGAFGCSTATGIPSPGGGGGSGVYRSTDGGATWTYILGNPGAFGFGFTPGGSVIAATSGPTGGNGGLFISSDDGASWPYGDCCYPRSLAITSNGNILAGDTYGAGGVFRSTNGGASWSQVGLGNTPIYSLVATASDHLFAGSASTGIYRSTDGVTWTQVNGTTNAVTSLAVSASRVFAGLYGNGVLRSSDDGATWTQFTSDLTDLRVEALAISSNGLIFAGTPSGVFVRSVQ